jgi:hypothetical protein
VHEGIETMTTQKTFKRRVRARAGKTGESYAAARTQLLRKADAAPADAPPPLDPMALTGMSDEAMRRGSGRSIGEWIEILDRWGGTEHGHTEIARWLVAEHGIGGWWSQSVTVAYERARGMRATNQRPDGYTVGISKTVGATADRVTDAFLDPAVRERWLPDAPIRVRTSQRGRTARFDWDNPPSRIGLYIIPKDGAKTQVTLELEKLPDAASVERLRAFWRERLAALKKLLEAEKP